LLVLIPHSRIGELGSLNS